MVITKTPLRISLLGGNTDFPEYFKKHGGIVLTGTIDKYIYCIVKKRFDDMIYINYSEKEKVSKIDDIKHDIAREALRMTGVKQGVEITFLSDIPSEGSGLGSSSAVAVGLLNALHNYLGESVSPWRLVREACRLEVDILKKPIGYQDQYAVTFGGTKIIKFKKNQIRMRHYNIKEDLLLYYTGKTRKAEKILSKMKLDNSILVKVKGLISNKQFTLAEKLDRYWQLKKKLNKNVTNKSIDKMYEKALSLGASGGKIVGAGGGGFLLLVVPLRIQDYFKKVFDYQEMPFRFSKYGSQVIFNINE